MTLQPSDAPSQSRLVDQPGAIATLMDTDTIDGTPQEDHIVKEGVERENLAIYGSFWLDKTEFALPVSVVQEVVNEPHNVSSIPLSPSYMLGLFSLRGMIIPIVDLRTLLDYPPLENNVERKVAIVEHGDLCIGLVFDKTGEVLNEKGATRVEFRSNENGIKDVVVEGLLKLENGERMVQILDPYEILKIQKIPRAEKASINSAAKSARGKRLNCISFQLGHTSCAIDLRYVQEVMEMPEVDQSLLANGCFIGTANLRGNVLPVVDFRSFMGDEPVFKIDGAALKGRKLLVVDTPKGQIGLMVFSIDSIVPYFEHEVMPFAKLALPRGDIVRGCLVDETKTIVMMLDHEHLLNDPKLIAAAESCREVHPNQKVEKHPLKGDIAHRRRTFILFTFDRCFAVDTSCVSEVINRPDDILEPPYALSFVEGIINLRGELITLIDPRLLYALPTEPREDQKVLIFKHEGQKYGVLVDSVDEIVMTSEKNVADLKPLDEVDTARSVSDDVVGCLNVASRHGGSAPVMIIDVGAFVERCSQAPG